MDEIIKANIREKYPEVSNDKDFDAIFDIIFSKLHMREIDASEVRGGMVVIDSRESAHLTGEIVLDPFAFLLPQAPTNNN